MGDLAIQVEGLSKRYMIGTVRYRPDTLREQVVERLRSLLPWRDPQRDAAVHWALDKVSFDVRHGEALGIIGANGSGKSTLLKILARITEPTTGRARMYGRVASLLEVGTGFDRDLTGRENVYLSGAILGMRRAEIRRKFDEIVAFSEIDRFIDTPVKRYSSGMYVRLAFAVAAHLDPEILLIDEVLAVGDARFQKKCLAKMQEFAESGRTVLFVSHDMSAVTHLCTRTILLEDGRVVRDGPSQQVANRYLSTGAAVGASREWPDAADAPQTRLARLRAVRVRNAEGVVADTVSIQEDVSVELEYDVLQDGHLLLVGFRFDNDNDLEVFSAFDVDPAWRRRPRPRGRYVSRIHVPGNFLSEGRLWVSAGIAMTEPWIPQVGRDYVVGFQVVEREPGAARGDYQGNFGGVVRPALDWTTTFASEPTGIEATRVEVRPPRSASSSTTALTRV